MIKTERIAIRLESGERDMLRELSSLLGTRTDSETVRALIRLHHAASKRAISHLRKARQS